LRVKALGRVVSLRRDGDCGLRMVMMGEMLVEKAVRGMRDAPGGWELGGW